MRKLTLILASAIGGFLSAATAAQDIALPAAATAAITLPARVDVVGGTVRLGEVAALLTHDVDTMRRLIELPIGVAPRAGQSVLVEREQLARWIRARLGLGLQTIVWQGSATLEVNTASRDLPGEDIGRAAESALRDWLRAFGQRIELHMLAAPRDLAVPAGKVALRVRPFVEAVPRQRMLVWVDLFVEDRFVRAVPVSFEVGVFTTVATAARDLPAGTPLTADLMARREVDIARLPEKAGEPLADSRDSRLRQPVRAGEVVGRRQIEATPAVSRGERATLLVNTGAVAVESRVEVLQDGHLGQTIRVRPAGQQGGTSLLARVAGPGLLEIAP